MFKLTIRNLKNRLLIRRRVRLVVVELTKIYLQLKNPWPQITKHLYEYFRNHPESQHIISLIDAAVIYNLVLKYKPRNCLDLGTGLGTSGAIIAHAMDRNGFGNVKSFEQLKWMVNEGNRIIDLHKITRLQIIHAECAVKNYFGQDFANYNVKYNGKVDMVIVDGPFHLSNVANPKSHYETILPNGDLFEIIPYLNNGAIIFVDARLSSMDAYRRYLGKRFVFTQSRAGFAIMEFKG